MGKRDSRKLSRGDLDAYFASTKPPGPMTFEVGARVGYTRYFLRQTCVPGTDPMWRQRGKVQSMEDYIVTVEWDDGTIGRVHSANLATPGPNTRWCE